MSFIHRMLDMQRDFAQINKFFETVKTGELVEIKDAELSKERGEDVWVFTQKNEEGNYYELLGSMDGWCDFFEALASHYKISYDDKPIRKLISKLRLNQFIDMQIISEAESVVKIQRTLHMRAEPKVYNAIRECIFEKQDVAA